MVSTNAESECDAAGGIEAHLAHFKTQEEADNVKAFLGNAGQMNTL